LFKGAHKNTRKTSKHLAWTRKVFLKRFQTSKLGFDATIAGILTLETRGQGVVCISLSLTIEFYQKSGSPEI
jgi:hypothetical protein